MQNLVEAIKIINPAANFSIDADLKITWLGDTEPISQAEIDGKIEQAKFELAMQNLRGERNQKLMETDFYALTDSSLSDEMKAYRQQLRDITQDLETVEDVNSVIWPTEPE